MTFGYRIDENKHFQPDPEKAPIVQDIFMRYASGESARSILNPLIEQGVKNQRGKKLTYSFVTNILKNRRYLGEYRFKDTVVENAFTPLVTPEIFNKCQEILATQRSTVHILRTFKTNIYSPARYSAVTAEAQWPV